MKKDYDIEKAKEELEKYRKTFKYNVKDEELNFNLKKSKLKIKTQNKVK